METPVNALPEMILLRAESLPEGGVLSPKEFLHLGSRTGINQALSRLTKAGKLLRAARGIYVAPVSGRFGMRAPARTRATAWRPDAAHASRAQPGLEATDPMDGFAARRWSARFHGMETSAGARITGCEMPSSGATR